MKIGRRIYYEASTGNIILDTGERQGHVVETTIEQDFVSYVDLAKRDPNSVGVLELEFGDLREDFATAESYIVDINTNELLFIYRDPISGDESFPTPSLNGRTAQLENENAFLALGLASTQMRLDQTEQEHADLILALVSKGVL